MINARQERLFQLSDQEWARIENCFPRRRGNRGFAQQIPSRVVFEAVLLRTRTGCPWRDLPWEYGHWHAIETRWRRWARAGVPQRAMVAWYLEQVAAGSLDRALVHLDSTVVRAHQHAAGALKEKGPQALGRSRGGLGTKIHAVVFNERQVLGIILTGGQAGDAPVGEELLEGVLEREEVKAVAGDRAYDSDAIRALLARAGKEAVIPPRANRKDKPAYDREKYKERNRIERFFNRLKQSRAVATRYDKLAEMFRGTVLAAMLLISLRC